MEEAEQPEPPPEGSYFGLFPDWYGPLAGLSLIGVGIYALVMEMPVAFVVGLIFSASVMVLQLWIRLPFWLYATLVWAGIACMYAAAVL